jgi:hypothetical protein
MDGLNLDCKHRKGHCDSETDNGGESQPMKFFKKDPKSNILAMRVKSHAIAFLRELLRRGKGWIFQMIEESNQR